MQIGQMHIGPLKRKGGGKLACLRLSGSRRDHAARAGRVIGGHNVDVVLSAPNLSGQAIHELTLRHGVLL